MKGDRVSGKDQGSVFTRHLVSGLRTGEADLNGGGNITVDELYTFARDHVIEEMPNQHPKRQEDVEGAIILAQNVKWDFPSYVRHSLTSPLAADRLSALDTLTRLYQIGNETVRTRVIAKTRKMVDDDSRLVSSAAADLLAAAGRTGEDNRIEVTARRAAEDERQRAADERAGSQPHLTTAAAALVETCVRKKLPDPKRAEKAAASWWSVSTSVGRVTANPEWNVLLPALPVRQFRGEGWVGTSGWIGFKLGRNTRVYSVAYFDRWGQQAVWTIRAAPTVRRPTQPTFHPPKQSQTQVHPQPPTVYPTETPETTEPPDLPTPTHEPPSGYPS